jgi:predicted HAD superfamily Cof-like phosphohydrolase
MNYKQHLQNLSLTEMAENFRQAYGVVSSSDQTATQKRLIAEEYREFDWSTAVGDPPEQQLKELADLVYVCYQYAANEDWDLDEAMKRVHASNMSKLNEYGKPIYREDGKVMKGPFYKPPNLTDLV